MVKRELSSDREVAWGWLAGVIVLSGVVRLGFLSKPSLWLDEIFSATFSTLSLGELLVAVIRFDIHPPLYYLQLWVWGFVSDSDAWLLLNSALWSVVSVLLTGVVGCRLFGKKVGLIAAFLLAVSPISIHYSQELRNYSLLMVLGIASWYRQEVFLDRGGRAPLLQAMALQAAICLSHAAGPFMAFMIASAGLAQIVAERKWQSFRIWLLAELGVGLIAAGVAANAMFRTVSLVTAPDASGVFVVFGKLIVGLNMAESLWLQAIGVAGMTMIWIGSWLAGRRRVGLLALTLGSFGMAFAVSHLLKPIWHERPFVFLEPFFALSLGLLVARVFTTAAAATSPRLALCVTGLLAMLVATLSVTLLRPPPPNQNYREAAAIILSNAQIDDGLVVDPRHTYWGMARYLAGPNWGSPLKVQPLVPYDDRWPDIIAKLPESVKRLSGIVPQTDFIEVGPLTMIIGRVDKVKGHVDRSRIAKFARLWVVVAEGRAHEFDRKVLDSLGRDVVERFDVPGLTIFLLGRAV